MTLKKWIKQHREQIDTAINSIHITTKLNDKERELWILNDEGLYNWARNDGVKI